MAQVEGVDVGALAMTVLLHFFTSQLTGPCQTRSPASPDVFLLAVREDPWVGVELWRDVVKLIYRSIYLGIRSRTRWPVRYEG